MSTFFRGKLVNFDGPTKTFGLDRFSWFYFSRYCFFIFCYSYIQYDLTVKVTTLELLSKPVDKFDKYRHYIYLQKNMYHLIVYR